MSRIENSKKNMGYGMAYQLLYLVMNFIVRVLILRKAGIETLSLNGLFLEVVVMLSIAELGVGASISYSLYRPLAESDEEKTASIMRVFRIAYWFIGIFVFLVGMATMPFVGRLITGIDVDISYVRLVYFLFIIRTAVPYFFSYKTTLLNADQKNHVAAKRNIVIRTAFFILDMLCLIFTGNYIAFLVLEAAYAIIYQACVSVMVDRMYPYLRNAKPLPKQEVLGMFTNIRRMFVGRMSNKVLNSTDNILISTMVSTAMVGIYSQYSMLTNGFLRLFAQANEAITGSIGNLLAIESPEYCEKKYRSITWLFFASGNFVSLCFFAGAGPFLKGFVGKDFLLDERVLMVVAMNLGFEIMKMPLWSFFGANGMFKEDQWISLAGCILNIIMSIALAKKIGMAGIFIGTFASLLFMTVFKISEIYRKAFHGGKGKYDLYLYLMIQACGLLAVYVFMNMTRGMSMPDVARFFMNCVFAAAVSLLMSVAPFLGSEQAQDGKKLTISKIRPGFL